MISRSGDPAFAPPSIPARFGIAAANVVAADFLLYDQPWGVSAAVTIALVGASVLATRPATFVKPGRLAVAALLPLAVLPLVENVSGLSVAVALAMLAVMSLIAARQYDPFGAKRERLAKALLEFTAFVPVRLIDDWLRARRAARRRGRGGFRFASVAVWTVPVVLGAVFLALFGAANPVIEYWFSLIDLARLLDFFSVLRIAFWLVSLLLIWALLRPRLRYYLDRLPRLSRRSVGHPGAGAPATERGPSAAQLVEDVVFGKAAILRALLVFNLMFAVETVLDATYLWGGRTLPDGLTYADFAHRSAYPLIATALLAAIFVLLALKPGSATSQDPLIRTLVYAWIAQNILLVISSIFRLDLYIGIYSLTYWRVAAFIWMGLVAVGLALIVARIALGKSNAWLSFANLLALSVTLYACCFINFAALIAHYNVEHSREISGQGVWLDFDYLRGLGPQALPATDEFLARSPGAAVDPAQIRLANDRNRAEEQHRYEQGYWRAWTFRDWRLRRYLDARSE